LKKFISSFSLFRIQYLLVILAMHFIVSCKTVRSNSEGTRDSKKYSKDNERSAGNHLSDKEKVEFDYHFFNANKEKILGNYDLAESLFLKALSINPNSAASMYELANIYAFQNNKRNALIYSKKAALIDPKNSWYQLLYIECLKEDKQYSEVINVYQKLLKEYPDRMEYYYEMANMYLSLNKINEAIKIYDEIEKVVGITDDASMQKIRIFRATNSFDKAILEAQKLITTFPKEGKYYGILGELYQSTGEPEKALAVYTDLIKLNPEDPYAHLTLADYYRNQHQKEKAFNEIKIAFKSKELDIDTKVKILLSYYSITETYTELKSDADELCKIIVEVHPNEAKAFSIYGDFLYRDKKLDEARIQYRKAIALDKEKYTLWNQLLIIESELNDFVSMQKESKEAMELFPNQALPYFLNGSANIRLKNYKDAVVALNQGKEFVFDNDTFLSQFYANIGDAQYQLKNYTASDSAYDMALEKDPQNNYVLNNYAYYLSLRKFKLEKAEAMSKKSIELEPNSNSYQDTYGWILYQMKKYEDAKIWIGKALANGGSDNGTLLEHYGDVLFRLNDIDNAIKYWMDAKKVGGASDFIDKKIADKKLYE
jgi:tetratricopeptide (TPR) repeat protein